MGDLYQKSRNAECWENSTISRVNGVPGCGTTTWLLSQNDTEKHVVVTITTEAAGDLREKLEP